MYVNVEASSRAPSTPAITTLFSVKSLTVADDRTVSAPEKFAPALPSTKAANVDTPEALKLSTSVCPTTSNPIPPEMCAPPLSYIPEAKDPTAHTFRMYNSVSTTTLNPTPPDPIQAKIFMFFPLFLTVILAPFPSGLVIYWTVNNILTMAQQVVIMKRTTVKTVQK